MAQIVRVHNVGGPEVLTVEEEEVGIPPAGKVKIRQYAVGLNFIDTYFRTGLYPARLPFIPGNEGAGVIVATGDGVTDLNVGDRVAYTTGLGGYASERIVRADRIVRLPDSISFEQAASMMLKGLTAQYLLHRSFKLESGQTILMHAAAGGVGQILTQWAAHLGATVIGTVGSAAKAEIALSNGCHHVIDYRQEDFASRVKEITQGVLCDVVYDGIGKDTFPASLSCIRRHGTFVSFGNASGPVPPFDMKLLSKHGSLFATRPSLDDFIVTRAEFLSATTSLMDVIAKGAVHIPVTQQYSLHDVQRAHRELEARATAGSSVLIPRI